jgi:hypothetical protein
MIIGIATLIMMLFGAGNQEIFFMDKLDQGIKKYVTDKDRKKELQSVLKEHTAFAKEFQKNYKRRAKLMKEKDLDKNTSDQWYRDFFDASMEERKGLQENAINTRMLLVKKINDEEWENILSISAEAAVKLEEKQQKEEMKKGINNYLQNMSNTINSSIAIDTKTKKVIEELKNLVKLWDEVVDTYEKFDVNHSELLVNKNASRDQYLEATGEVNQLRMKLNESYIDFLRVLKDNTDETEYTTIIKYMYKRI